MLVPTLTRRAPHASFGQAVLIRGPAQLRPLQSGRLEGWALGVNGFTSTGTRPRVVAGPLRR